MDGAARGGAAPGVGGGAPEGGPLLDGRGGLGGGRFPPAVFALHEFVALGVAYPMAEFISVDIGDNRRAVRLGPGDGTPVGGSGGKDPEDGQDQDEG